MIRRTLALDLQHLQTSLGDRGDLNSMQQSRQQFRLNLQAFFDRRGEEWAVRKATNFTTSHRQGDQNSVSLYTACGPASGSASMEKVSMEKSRVAD